MATSYEELETRVAALETLIQQLKLEKIAKVLSGPKKSAKSTHRIREYTHEERAAIRARLFAGQQEAAKRRESESEATKKVTPSKSEKTKSVQKTVERNG